MTAAQNKLQQALIECIAERITTVDIEGLVGEALQDVRLHSTIVKSVTRQVDLLVEEAVNNALVRRPDVQQMLREFADTAVEDLFRRGTQGLIRDRIRDSLAEAVRGSFE